MKILNRDAIKYIAMFTMLCNHIAHMFLLRGTPLYEFLEDIGYFAAPVMCFFLVEGYFHTRSKFKYGGRLFFFTVLSQYPFYLAFGWRKLNMIFTLFCCFLILVVLERVDSYLLQNLLCVLLILVTVISDWAVVAPLLTFLLAKNWGDNKGMWASYVEAALLFVMLNALEYIIGQPAALTVRAVCRALFSGLGILAAGAAVLVFYNGQRAKKGQNFSKWFFYFFYPGHLIILSFVKLVYITYYKQ